MSIIEFLSPVAEICKRRGPEDRIVMSSRVRLARNLEGHAFPGWAQKSERVEIFEKIRPSVEELPEIGDHFTASMDKFSNLEKQILVERHLISREHAAKSAGSGLIVNKDESLSVMINEEDHLRMQALFPGLQLFQAWETIDSVDTQLEDSLSFAFNHELGYHTACPTNLGTAIRVSAMLHLPGLVLSEQINQIIQAVSKLGLAVRGLYGEGTEALGNVFQVSNQMTLGESENDIVDRLTKVVRQMIEHEENARASLLEKRQKMVLNHVGRAYGILTNAHSIASKETMNLLSLIRLGLDFKLFGEVERTRVDELFITTQPAHLQRNLSDKMKAEQRDLMRAEILRESLGFLPRPKESIPPNAMETGEAK